MLGLLHGRASYPRRAHIADLTRDDSRQCGARVALRNRAMAMRKNDGADGTREERYSTVRYVSPGRRGGLTEARAALASGSPPRCPCHAKGATNGTASATAPGGSVPAGPRPRGAPSFFWGEGWGGFGGVRGGGG